MSKQLEKLNNFSYTSQGEALHLLHKGVRDEEQGVRQNYKENQLVKDIPYTPTPLTPNSAEVEAGVLDAFDERAAIAQMDGGLTRGQAEHQAARDQGFADAQTLRFAVVAGWLRQVNAWGADHADDPFLQSLLTDARTFCGSEWAVQALQLGWGELDLFAVHGDASEARLDGRGLVASLDGRPIAAMTADTSLIQCPAGHHLTYRRRPFDPQRGAVLLWELGQ